MYIISLYRLKLQLDVRSLPKLIVVRCFNISMVDKYVYDESF